MTKTGERTTWRRLAGVSAAVCLLCVLPARAARSDVPEKLPPRNEATLREILKAGGEANRDVRARVAWVAGRMGRAEALAAVRRLACDPAPGVRAGALRALCTLLPRGAWVQTKLATPVAPSSLRQAALVAAARLNFMARGEVIEQALKGSDVAECILAARALGLDTAAVSRPMLLQALEDPHVLVRAEAVRTLGYAADDEAVARVLAALSAENGPDAFMMRAAACDALARMKTVRGRSRLYAAAGDDHFVVRRRAIEALVALRDARGVPAIQGRMTERDYTVRVAACVALGRLVDGTSAPLLAARLSDGTAEVRDAADAVLAGFPPDLAYGALLKYVDAGEPADTPGGRTVRHRVWRLLGDYGHPGTREAAFAHLDDRDIGVQVPAFRILRKLGDRRIMPLCLEVLRATRKKTAMTGPAEGLIEESFNAAAVFMRREGIPTARLVLKKAMVVPVSDTAYVPGDRTTLAAAAYLGAIKDSGSVSVLEEALEQMKDRVEVAQAVAAALKAITGRDYPAPVRPKRVQAGFYFIDVRPAASGGQSSP